MNFSLKAKELSFNSARVQYFIAFISFFSLSRLAMAQVESEIRPPSRRFANQGRYISHKSRFHYRSDRYLPRTVNDSTKVKPPPKGDIETTINYSARDSIRASVDGKLIWLYGEAKIEYGEIELEAEEITIDYGNSTLTAHGTRDSLGQRVGYPIFKNGPELYETKDIIYNFKTKRHGSAK